MARKPDPELVKMTKSPDELYQWQRSVATSKAKEVIQGLMYKLQSNYDEGKPFKWTFPETVSTMKEVVKELVVEAMEAQGWKMKKEKGRTYTITKGSGSFDNENWYGTLKIAGDNSGTSLLVVKTNPEMETGYDIITTSDDGGLNPHPDNWHKHGTGDEVHVLDEGLGWTWIGRITGEATPPEVQALELLKIHHDGKPKAA